MKITKFITRWVLCACSLAGAFLLIRRASNSGGFSEAAAFAMVGIGVLVSSVFWIIPETVTPIAGFIGDCWGSIFFPNARYQKPPLSYLLVEFYCKHGRHEEAIEESLKIIHYYPDEQRAYLDVIELCKTIGATEMAAKYERRFRKRFRTVQRRQRNRS